jgi:hypothetical protein
MCKVCEVSDGSFRRSIEDYKMVDEVQEGFRPNRSTERQVTKLQKSLGTGATTSYYLGHAVSGYQERLQRDKSPSNVGCLESLWISCKTWNSSVACIQSMWISAACFLLRGVLKCVSTSPNVFNVAFNPVHVLVWACKRGCIPLEGADPSGPRVGSLMIRLYTRTAQMQSQRCR